MREQRVPHFSSHQAPDSWSKATNIELNIAALAYFPAGCYHLMKQTPHHVEKKCLADLALISSHRTVSKYNGVILFEQ